LYAAQQTHEYAQKQFKIHHVTVLMLTLAALPEKNINVHSHTYTQTYH